MNNKYIGSIILEASPEVDPKETTTIVTTTGMNNHIVAETILIDCDAINRNKRAYATADMKKEIDGPRIKELLESGNLRGEDGHPISSDMIRQQSIDPKLCSVKYTKLWMEDNLVKAHYHGTNNQYGEALNKDLKDGDLPSFSLRALGTIQNEHGKAYVKNLRVITWDRVIFPSHKKAYTLHTVQENVNLYEQYTGKKFYEDDYYNTIKTMNENGLIINLNDKDAKKIINTLQRENASIDTIFETFEGIADRIQVVGNKILLTTAFGESIYIPYDRYIDSLIKEYVYSL